MKNKVIKISKEDLDNIVIDIKYKTVTPLEKFLMDRRIRRIHDASQFGMTKLVEAKLKETGLYESNTMGKYEKTKLNRELKKIGFKDSLMIEHMYSVKKMVDGLFNLKDKLNGIDDSKIVLDYLENNTNCIMKFTKLEKDLHG